jgi:predicted aspartyl protease
MGKNHFMKFRIKNGMIIVDVFIEGKNASRTLTSIIDTGSSMTTIDTNVLEGLGYSAKDGDNFKDVFTADGADTQGYTLKVKGFETCDIRLGDFKVLAYDLLEDPKHEKTDCLIGYNFLRHFKVTIDYKSQELLLIKSL